MLFASDLDNTLIHSYKKAVESDICVEQKEGKELSYMTKEIYTLLPDVAKKCEFVPVTTRSLEQYRRIDFGFVPQYGIAAHGAILLVNGEVDEAWTRETRALINVELPVLTESTYIFDIRYVDDFFIFAKSEDPTRAVSYLQSIISDEKLFICAVHNKVYVLPTNLQKGIAVKRLAERLKETYVLCAGDSTLDIPMLEIADLALHPQTLTVKNPNNIRLEDKTFSRHMLKHVDELLR